MAEAPIMAVTSGEQSRSRLMTVQVMHDVIAQVAGEQGAHGAVDQAAGQHGGQRGTALAAHEGARDAAHGVQLLFKVDAQGEEIHAIAGTGGGGDGHHARWSRRSLTMAAALASSAYLAHLNGRRDGPPAPSRTSCRWGTVL